MGLMTRSTLKWASSLLATMSCKFFCFCWSIWKCPFSLVTPLLPSSAHHKQGRRSRHSSELRDYPLHGLWQVTLSVSAPSPSVKQERARLLWDFFISIYKALCDHQQEGIEESESIFLPLKSCLLQSSGTLGTITFVWLVHTGLPTCPHVGQSPAWVLAWVRSCLASLLLWCHATHDARLVN